MEGCLFHRNSDPTWSVARDGAQEQKKRLGGEPYKLSHNQGFATPSGDMRLNQKKYL